MHEGRLPPHDTDAEEAVIGSLLIDGAAIYKIADSLQAQDFSQEQNQSIYAACLALYQRNEAINQITVAQELSRQNKLETCGGAAYLSHLISIVPTSLHIEHFARIVYRLSIMRGLIRAGREIEAIGYAADPDIDASLNKAEDSLFRLRHGQSARDFVHIRQILDEYFETSAAVQAGQTAVSQVMTGFTGVDELLNGLQRSDLVIVAGRPSMGKTTVALGIARNAAVNQRATVAMFSLEMTKESLVLRLLSAEANVNTRRVNFILQKEGEEDRWLEEEKRIMDATGVLSEAPIYIDDSPLLRVVEMRSKARRLYFERGLDLIIVDHLGLMHGDTKGENRVQEISLISRSLKALARELNVPVIAVSQLSRASEWRSSHKPQLSDLRDSGSIEQDADIVLFIYRDDYYYKPEEWEAQHPGTPYPEGIANIIIAKHRNGPTGEINLRFVPRVARFENIPVSSQEPSLL